MTTVDATITGETVRIHLGGGLFGDASHAFSEFRKAVDAGDAGGSYEASAASGTVTGSFVAAVLSRTTSVRVTKDGKQATLPTAEVLALVEPDAYFGFDVVEF